MYTFEYLVNPSLSTNEFKLAKVCLMLSHMAQCMLVTSSAPANRVEKGCMVASFAESVGGENWWDCYKCVLCPCGIIGRQDIQSSTGQDICYYHGVLPYAIYWDGLEKNDLKVHKWHAWNLCIRLVKGLHELCQTLPTASMGNGTINFTGEYC